MSSVPVMSERIETGDLTTGINNMDVIGGLDKSHFRAEEGRG